MPKAYLKLIFHEEVGTLFVRIVDFFLPDGTPVISDTRVVRTSDADSALRVFDMAMMTNIVRMSDSSEYLIIGGEYATV